LFEPSSQCTFGCVVQTLLLTLTLDRDETKRKNQARGTRSLVRSTIDFSSPGSLAQSTISYRLRKTVEAAGVDRLLTVLLHLRRLVVGRRKTEQWCNSELFRFPPTRSTSRSLGVDHRRRISTSHLCVSIAVAITVFYIQHIQQFGLFRSIHIVARFEHLKLGGRRV